MAPLLERMGDPQWLDDKDLTAALQQPLTQLCAHYLLRAKQGEEPLDPVARFHLSNGARMERINWMGDTSEAGMFRSAGLMVNYVYKLADVERNHEAYVKERKVITSSRLESLAKDAPLSRRAAAR